MEKIILDLCGGTGSWSKPYRDAGYKVLNITLPEYDVRKTMIGKECLFFGSPESRQVKTVKIKDVYGVLAAPPCTEFSRAKTTKPRDFEKGLETVEACLKIVWGIQKQKKLEFWALENPMGLLSRFLGNPPYMFRQWWFGNDRSKETHIWGRFTPPKRLVFEPPIFLAKASHSRNAKWYSNATAEKRAITPAGFAKAFYKANP